jgi:hypothetical protein
MLPRRRRYTRLIVALLSAIAATLAVLVWHPSSHPAQTARPTVAPVGHRATVTAPAKAGITVTANGQAYACTIASKTTGKAPSR